MTIIDNVDEYYQGMPEFKNKALGSFLFSFTINSANLGATFANCAASGGISVLASVVDACTTPIFTKYLADDHGKMAWQYKAIKNLTIITGVSALTVGAVPQAVLMSVIAFGYVFSAWYFSEEGKCDANTTSMYAFTTFV